MIYKLTDVKLAEPVFAGCSDTLILSCLQNIMGEIYADNKKCPRSCMAILGDFCFLAGEPNGELAAFRDAVSIKQSMILIPQNEMWSSEIENAYGERAKKVFRYALKKEADIFNADHLKAAVSSLPEGYELKQIDENIYNICWENDWSRDFVSQYKDYASYAELGLGMAVLKDGELVSAASSYSSYIGGIEIEIATKAAYRRLGLAFSCAAALILECQNRRLYPSWDAQNLFSLSLAQKLGYNFSHEYVAYNVCV